MSRDRMTGGAILVIVKKNNKGVIRYLKGLFGTPWCIYWVINAVCPVNDERIRISTVE